VRTFNSAGYSGDSNESYARTFDTPPAGPTSLRAIATSATQVSLNWLDNSNNEDGFEVENRVGVAGSWLRIATVGPNVRYYNHKKVGPDVFFGYRVRAYNTGGYSVYSNESWVRTPRLNTAARPAWTLYR